MNALLSNIKQHGLHLEAQYVYMDSNLSAPLASLLNQFKLVYGLFGQSNMHITFCPSKAWKETNVHLH